MRSWKVRILVVIAAVCSGLAVYAETAPGSTVALQIGIGTQGILSYQEVGVRFPVGSGGFSIAAKARLLSSLTWATFVNRDTGQAVSFHPDVVGGVLSFGGRSPLVGGVLRARGATDILLGYSFTRWDSAIYGIGNLIGDNLTFALIGSFGVELFAAPRVSVCLDAGGGWKSLFGDKANPYVIAG